MKSNKIFKFGDNGMLKSEGKYFIPIKVVGKSWTMDLDIVKSLLMSKDMIKKMKMVIDLEDDTLLVEGKRINQWDPAFIFCHCKRMRRSRKSIQEYQRCRRRDSFVFSSKYSK